MEFQPFIAEYVLSYALHLACYLVSRFPTVIGLFATLGLFFGNGAGHAEFRLTGFGLGRALLIEAPVSSRAGGFGRLAYGSADQDNDVLGLGRLNLTGEWQTDSGWLARLAFVGQSSSVDTGNQDLGITELFLEKQWQGERSLVRLRAGYFFLPTSRENVDPGWASRYALSFSAINSWIGEEVRPTGLLLSTGLGRQSQFEIGASVFGGNDTAGTLLAWRGWTIGDRIVTFSEVVPLPPLQSLGDPAVFGDQLDAGTKPFGKDLDGRAGWSGFVRWQPEDWFSVTATRYDSRGDKDLHGDGSNGEYAWATDFDLVGADLHLGRWDLVGEWLGGHTGMGDVNFFHVNADIDAYYGLISWQPTEAGSVRFTLRYDTFSTRDIDGTTAELNDDDGSAWTLAMLWTVRESLRIGLELQDVEGRRPEAGRTGFPTANAGQTMQLELRYRFDFSR